MEACSMDGNGEKCLQNFG